MKTFILRFTNGKEIRRLCPAEQYPDEIYAMMHGQRLAPLVFKQPWNMVEDQTQWQITVHSNEGHLLIREPFAATR
jgi:hypothetical protein